MSVELDGDRLRCGNCGDDLLPSQVRGHLLSEGRLMDEPSNADPLTLTGGWTITIVEHSGGGYYEPPYEYVAAEWSSPHVNPIRVNEPTIEDALRAIRSQLSASYGRFADHEDGPRTPVSG